VDYKPEVRKAGGVYYTPKYIVDYIVSRTLGELLDGGTPRTARELKVVDPACGSGSFLLGAYQYLLDWHLSWYEAHGPQRLQRQVYRGPGREWRLTVEERKRILLANIFGVDVDPQAVEVTKLSLLLKVLENETEDSIARQRRLFHAQRVLPDLGDNIKCGNSLMDTDFDRTTPRDLFDVAGGSAARPTFDWRAAFPRVFSKGGFDAVIGNPPWGAEFNPEELGYLRERYRAAVDRMVDSYIYFLYVATLLTKHSGYVGFIVPGTVLNQVDAQSVRRVLLERGVREVVNLGQGVFGPKVLNTSCVLVSKGGHEGGRMTVADLAGASPRTREGALQGRLPSVSSERWRRAVQADPHLTFFTGSMAAMAILFRLRRTFPLFREALEAEIQRGVTPDVVSAHVLGRSEARRLDLESEILRPSVSGEQIKRWCPWREDQVIVYTARDTPIDSYPRVLNHLAQHRSENSCPEVKDKKHPWWALHRPRDPQIFRSPKLIGITTSKRIEVIFDERRSLYVTDAMYVIHLRPEMDKWAAMAILQSRLFLFLYRGANQGDARVIPQVKASKLHELPFPDVSSEVAKALSSAGRRMLTLNGSLARARDERQIATLERELSRLDREIDATVYELYRLRTAEITLVEETLY